MKEEQCDNFNKQSGELIQTYKEWSKSSKSSNNTDINKNRLCFGVCGPQQFIENTVCKSCPENSDNPMCVDDKSWFTEQKKGNIPDLRYHSGPEWSDKQKVFKLWSDKNTKLTDAEIIQLGGEINFFSDDFKKSKPSMYNTMDEWKKAINNNRGSKVDCVEGENKPLWAECVDDKFGPNDVIPEEVYDWYKDTYIDTSAKKNKLSQLDWSLFKGFKRNYQFEKCINGLLDTGVQDEYKIMERIKNYTSILDWREEDIRYIEKKLKKIISLHPEKSSKCIHILHIKENICRAGISEKLFTIFHLISSILDITMDLSSIREGTPEYRKMLHIINRLGHLVPKVFVKIIEISKYFELQKCHKVSSNTLLLEKIYTELLVKPSSKTINWGIDIDFSYFEKLSVVEFVKTIVLILVFSYLIKSILEIVVAITTRK